MSFNKMRSAVSMLCMSGIYLLFVLFTGCASSKSSTPAASGNFIAPDYVKKNYSKILVICKIDPDTYRKRVERGVVSELKDHRYNAGTAYEFVTSDLMADTAKLRSTIEGQGYDAAILLTYLGQLTTVTDEYTVNGNMYNILGGSYPVVGLETDAQKVAHFQADFFIAGKRGTQWRSTVRGKLGRDLDIATQQMAMELRKKLQADRIL